MITFAVAYLLLINLVTFALYGIDKWRAKHNRWRISEKMLLLFALMGGSIGALLGMRTWRHKTQHAKFKYGIPLIIIVQMGLTLLFTI